MALRRSATGKRLVDAGCEISADAPFEAHVPKLALFCLRLTKDREKVPLVAPLAVSIPVHHTTEALASRSGGPATAPVLGPESGRAVPPLLGIENTAPVTSRK